MPDPHRIGRLGGGFLLLTAAITLLAACSPYEVDSRDHLDRLERSGYPVVFLAAPRLLMNHASYEAYGYGTDLAELLGGEGRIPVMTAWEVDASEEQDGEVANHQLMALIDQAGISVTDVLIAELRIAESATSRTVQVPLQMGGGLEHQYQSDIQVTLTLRTATYREEVAVFTVAFEDPPFSEDTTAANPRPVLRDGVLRAGEMLIELFEERFEGPPADALPDVELAYNPRDLFVYREAGETPLDYRFNGMDELDRLASRMVYYQYFDPAISGSRMRLFERSDPGLVVVAVGDDARGLRPGDYIDEVNGARVAGRYSFTRAFLLGATGGDVRLALTREGERRVARVRVEHISD